MSRNVKVVIRADCAPLRSAIDGTLGEIGSSLLAASLRLTVALSDWHIRAAPRWRRPLLRLRRRLALRRLAKLGVSPTFERTETRTHGWEWVDPSPETLDRGARRHFLRLVAYDRARVGIPVSDFAVAVQRLSRAGMQQ